MIRRVAMISYQDRLYAFLRVAREELSELQRRREVTRTESAQLETSIEDVQKAIEVVGAIWRKHTDGTGAVPLGDIQHSLANFGLTESIAYVLQTVGVKLSPAKIRDKLVIHGYDFSNYKSTAIGSVSKTLERLARGNKIERIKEGYHVWYRWGAVTEVLAKQEENVQKIDNAQA
jgi:hypothetical protein